MKLFSYEGHQLDGEFNVEESAVGFEITLESSGGPTGGRKRRNTDYKGVLELLLERCGQCRLVLTNVHVASAVAERLPIEERAIEFSGFELPLKLSSCGDHIGLRIAIGRAVGRFGVSPEKS